MIGFQSARLLAQQSGGVRTLWHIIDSFSMSHFYGSVSSCRSVLTVPNQCDDDDNFLKLKYKPKQKNGPTEAPVKAPPRCPRGHRWRTADFHRLHTVRIKNIKKNRSDTAPIACAAPAFTAGRPTWNCKNQKENVQFFMNVQCSVNVQYLMNVVSVVQHSLNVESFLYVQYLRMFNT